MALTRARVVYGSAAARKAVREVIDSVLVTARDRTALARDIVKMRADMATHKPPLGPLDVKLAPGGLLISNFPFIFINWRAASALIPICRQRLGHWRMPNWSIPPWQQRTTC